jgi:hypothetical protein
MQVKCCKYIVPTRHCHLRESIRTTTSQHPTSTPQLRRPPTSNGPRRRSKAARREAMRASSNTTKQQQEHHHASYSKSAICPASSISPVTVSTVCAPAVNRRIEPSSPPHVGQSCLVCASLLPVRMPDVLVKGEAQYR